MKDFVLVELLFLSNKTRAIRSDQNSNNHKVTREVHNTDDAETHFDDITLYKGASLLKYLSYIEGDEKFFQNIKKYLKENIHEKSVDFNTFTKYFDNNQACFDGFKKIIENEGLVKLEYKYTLSTDDKIEDFQIMQTACDNAPYNLFYDLQFDVKFFMIL